MMEESVTFCEGFFDLEEDLELRKKNHLYKM